MADYSLSAKADSDLCKIYKYSFKHFGEIKADAYLISLEEKFLFLAQNPKTGTKIDHIRKGYYKYNHMSHTVFYKIKSKAEIQIVRVLHNSMDQETQLN